MSIGVRCAVLSESTQQRQGICVGAWVRICMSCSPHSRFTGLSHCKHRRQPSLSGERGTPPPPPPPPPPPGNSPLVGSSGGAASARPLSNSSAYQNASKVRRHMHNQHKARRAHGPALLWQTVYDISRCHHMWHVVHQILADLNHLACLTV